MCSAWWDKEMEEIPEISFRINEPRIQEDERSHLIFRHKQNHRTRERVSVTSVMEKLTLHTLQFLRMGKTGV